jgi:hypothetical protein
MNALQVFGFLLLILVLGIGLTASAVKKGEQRGVQFSGWVSTAALFIDLRRDTRLMTEQLMSARAWRLIGLQIVTGLIVAFVRHDLEAHRAVWDSFEQFLVSWLIHTVALAFLLAFVGFAILQLHKFFLGVDVKDNWFEVWFYTLMTVLVASVFIFLIAHYGPTEDEEVHSCCSDRIVVSSRFDGAT